MRSEITLKETADPDTVGGGGVVAEGDGGSGDEGPKEEDERMTFK